MVIIPMERTLSNTATCKDAVRPEDFPGLDLAFRAGVDLRQHRWCAVALDALGQLRPCGPQDNPLGVLQNAPDAGQDAIVRMVGPTQARFAQPVSEARRLIVVNEDGELGPIPEDREGRGFSVLGLSYGATKAKVANVHLAQSYDATAVVCFAKAVSCPCCGVTVSVK